MALKVVLMHVEKRPIQNESVEQQTKARDMQVSFLVQLLASLSAGAHSLELN